MKTTASTSTPACNARIILCTMLGEIFVLPCYEPDPTGAALVATLSASSSTVFAAVIYDKHETPHFYADGKLINPLDAQRRVHEAQAWWQDCKREYAMTRKFANG